MVLGVVLVWAATRATTITPKAMKLFAYDISPMIHQACCRVSLRFAMSTLLGCGLCLSRQFVTLRCLVNSGKQRRMQSAGNLIWVDMEMTGLDPDKLYKKGLAAPFHPATVRWAARR